MRLYDTNLTSPNVPAVLGYHGLPPEASPDPYDITFPAFIDQIDDFRSLGARFPEDLDLFSMRGSEPSDGIKLFITFDDGHATDLSATEALTARGIRPILFITTGFLGKGSKWLTADALRTAHGLGAVVASHGQSHAFLNQLSNIECRHELAHSKQELEDIIGASVDSFSFPGGRYNRRIIDIAREEGYTKMFTSKPSLDFQTGGKDWILIHRFILRRSMTASLLQKILHRDSMALRKAVAIYEAKKIARWVLGDENYQRFWEMLYRR